MHDYLEFWKGAPEDASYEGHNVKVRMTLDDEKVRVIVTDKNGNPWHNSVRFNFTEDFIWSPEIGVGNLYIEGPITKEQVRHNVLYRTLKVRLSKEANLWLCFPNAATLQ